MWDWVEQFQTQLLEERETWSACIDRRRAVWRCNRKMYDEQDRSEKATHRYFWIDSKNETVEWGLVTSNRFGY